MASSSSLGESVCHWTLHLVAYCDIYTVLPPDNVQSVCRFIGLGYCLLWIPDQIDLSSSVWVDTDFSPLCGIKKYCANVFCHANYIEMHEMWFFKSSCVEILKTSLLNCSLCHMPNVILALGPLSSTVNVTRFQLHLCSWICLQKMMVYREGRAIEKTKPGAYDFLIWPWSHIT